mgnify:CR=1 FL=1
MKKLVSLLLVAVMLSASFLTIPVMAEENDDYFTVSFDTGLDKFIVTATSALEGRNRVLLLVKDGDDTLYMDAMNDVTRQDVYFSVDLGKVLERKEYTFIVSSNGDTVAAQTLTCMAEVPDVPKYFTVEYDEADKAFKVNSVPGYYKGTNRVILTVYQPSFGGYQEIWYMDAANNAQSFNFVVPVSDLAPIGKYTFRVSVIGDMLADGVIGLTYNQGFTTYTEEVEDSTDIKMGGKYILKNGEELEDVAVYVALYKKGEEDEVPRLVRATYSDDISVAAEVKYIQSDITLTEDERTKDYYVRVYAWKQATLYPLAASITIDQE